MSTEEATSQMDTGLPVPSRPSDQSGEKKKTSLLKKVKDKAKKLRSKLKPGSGHREEESPAHDHDDDTSSSSDEEDNDIQETGHTPLSSTVNRDDDKRTAHADYSVPLSEFDYQGSRPKDQSDVPQEDRKFGVLDEPAKEDPAAPTSRPKDESDVSLGGGLGEPQEDRKFGVLDEPAKEDPAAPTSTDPISSSSPLSQFRSAGPADAEQAVPTSYNYYNKDPSAAYKTPSPEALGIASGASDSGKRDESPSALGDEYKSPSESFGRVSQPDYSERSVERPEEEDRHSKIPVAILAPGAVGTDSKSGREEDSYNRDDDSLTARGFSQPDYSSTSVDRPEEEDQNARIPAGILAPGAVGTDSKSGRDYDQDVGIATPTSDVKGTLGAVKDAAAEKVGYGSTDEQTPRDTTSSTESEKPIHIRAYEGLTGAAVGVGQKLGVYRDYDHPTSETGSEPTLTQKAYDTVVGAKDAAAEKISGPTSGEPSVGEKAYDTATGARDATADRMSGSAEGISGGEPTVTQKAYGAVLGAKDAAADKLGYNSNQPSSTTGTTQEVTGEPLLTQKAYGAVLGAKDAVADKLGYNTNQPSTTAGTTGETGEPPVTQKAYETVVGAKDAVADKVGYNTNQPGATTGTTQDVTGEPTMAQKAYDTIVGTKDAVASKLPLGGNTSEQPVSQRAYDTTVDSKDTAADTISRGTGTGEPTATEKAYGTLLGVKDAAADKLGVGSRAPASTTSDETSTNTGSFFDSKAAPVSEFNEGSDQSKPVTQRAAETATGLKDSIANTLGVGGTSNSPTSEVGNRGLTSGTEGKPLTEKATETGGSLLETVATKLGYQGSATRTPTEQATEDVKGRGLEAKDVGVDNLKQADVAASSDSTPMSQKAADTAYRVKDATASTLSPTEHDKALSQSVTESISNLPTLLTEKLGFGGNKSAASTPSGTSGVKDFGGASELDVPVSDNTQNLSPAANTPESPASGGIVDRVTGAVSSFFGGNKRTSVTGAGEEYSPAASPSGEARRDVTDTSPMVTDLSDNTHRSSPAA